MSGLTLLNGSTVDALERRDSELHYLRGLLAQAEERPAQLQVFPLLPWLGLLVAASCHTKRQTSTSLLAGSHTWHCYGGGYSVHACHRPAS